MTQFNYSDTRRANGCYVQFARIIEPDQCPDASWLEQDGFEDRLAAYRAGELELVHIAAEARCFIVRDGVGAYANLRSPGVGGVESDSGEEYLAELYQEEISNLKDMIAAFANPIYE